MLPFKIGEWKVPSYCTPSSLSLPASLDLALQRSAFHFSLSKALLLLLLSLIILSLDLP
jgi:hypothetical protein